MKGDLYMGVPEFDSPEEEIKKWINHIALICLSEDFKKLKNELEVIYRRYNIEKFMVVAFEDALYSFLAQEDSNLAAKPGKR